MFSVGHRSVLRTHARFSSFFQSSLFQTNTSHANAGMDISNEQYDSYNGINVKLRYMLRVTVARQYRYRRTILDARARGGE